MWWNPLKVLKFIQKLTHEQGVDMDVGRVRRGVFLALFIILGP